MNNILSLDRLDKILEEKGMNLTQLAQKYDTQYGTEKGETIYNTLRHWHQGKGNPTLEKLIRICDILECDIDYLLGRIEDSTHTIKFIKEQTGLSENAIKVLREWNQISKQKGAEYDWARNALQILNQLLVQGIILTHNVLLPIADYIIYRFKYEHEIIGIKNNLNKYRLALFTATDGLSECIKNIYLSNNPTNGLLEYTQKTYAVKNPKKEAPNSNRH